MSCTDEVSNTKAAKLVDVMRTFGYKNRRWCWCGVKKKHEIVCSRITKVCPASCKVGHLWSECSWDFCVIVKGENLCNVQLWKATSGECPDPIVRTLSWSSCLKTALQWLNSDSDVSPFSLSLVGEYQDPGCVCPVVVSTCLFNTVWTQSHFTVSSVSTSSKSTVILEGICTWLPWVMDDYSCGCYNR